MLNYRLMLSFDQEFESNKDKCGDWSGLENTSLEKLLCFAVLR